MSIAPFNESPEVIIKPVSSSSINTTETDPYRQGVELTQEKHYQAGPVKIHAGEPGHQLRPNTAGEPAAGTLFPDDMFFQEIDMFDPVLYMTNNVDFSFLSQKIAFRASTTTDGFNYDGIIEPLAIRTVVTFMSVNASLEPHSVHGSVESANFNPFIHADRIVDVQKFLEVTVGSFPFEDNTDSMNDMPLNVGYFPMETRRIFPFDDSQLKIGHFSLSTDDEMRQRVTEMNPGIDNYIPFDCVNPATGFYD